jgi:RNA polymerase sigma-70 factor (ECF subfamily)
VGARSQIENRNRAGCVLPDVKADQLILLDEDGLLRAVARGDQLAFEELYRRTSGWLLLRLQRRCTDADLVTDVLQDTYLTIWRAADSFKGSSKAGSGSAVGWIWTIAARKLIDKFRQRARPQSPPPALVHEQSVGMPSAEDVVLGGVMDNRLAAAWVGLSPELHSVLQAMVLDGLSVRETSILLGLPQGTVKTRARRARLALQEGLS